MALVDVTGEQQAGPVAPPPPRLDLTTPPPSTPFIGGRLGNLPGYVDPNAGRVLQPYQVEDRNLYLQAKLDMLNRLRNVGPQFVAHAQQGAEAADQYAQQQRQEHGPSTDDALADFQQRGVDTSDPRYTYLSTLAHNDPIAYFAAVGQEPPGTTPGVGIAGFFKPALQLATTEITPLKPVARLAGELGTRVGETAIKGNEGPLGLAERFLPEQARPSHIAGQVVGGLAEALVPTQVWQAALELIPGVGSVPDLLREVKAGAPDAIAALTRAGEQLGESDTVKVAMGRLAEERGSLKIPGSGTKVDYKALAEAPSVLEPSDIAYHGTGQRFTSFDEGRLDTTALYGPGVYLTDSADIAKSYATKRAARGGEATIQSVAVRPGLRVLNMERTLPADAANVYRRMAAELDSGDVVDDALTAGKAGKDVSRAFQQALSYEGIPHYEAGDILDTLNQQLQAAGYDGITHVGGIQGGAKHTVTVIFDPANAEIVTPRTRALDIFNRFASEERGSVKLPGGGEELPSPSEAGPESAGRLTPDNSPAPPETPKSALPAAAQTRIKTTGVQGALVIGERYASDSAERQAVIQAIQPQIAHLPEVNQKVINASLETLPSKADRQVATEAQRARQAVMGSRAFDETPGTPMEKAAASIKAFAGKQAQRFTPIGGRFTDAENSDLQDQIVQAAASGKIGKVFERNNALDALNLLMTGQRLPGNESKPLNLAPHEIKLLGRVFGPEVEAALPRTPEHFAAFQRFVDVLNMPRAIVTALDVSAAGRQGILLAFRNPNEARKSIMPMIEAMASDEGFNRAAENLRANKAWDDALGHGLELTDVAESGNLPNAEESFQTGMIDKLPPGLKQAVKGSERGFVMYLDNIRLLTYEKNANRIANVAMKDGVYKTGWDAARVDLVKSQVARFINHATGRGDIGFLGQYAPAMNAAFFAPRFFVSRPQAIWDMVRPGADPFTRQIVFENLGAFVGAGVATLAAAKLSGYGDVELDPRSSDFGKMQLGNTRIDFWGGYQPIARYIAQFSTADNKQLFTGKQTYVYPGTTALRFFRSKLSPGGSLIYDYTVGGGKNYNGDALFFSDPKSLGLDRETATKAWNDFGQRILPLSIQDAINGYEESGAIGGAAAGTVSTVGGSTSSFAPSTTAQKTLTQQKVLSALDQAGFGQDAKNAWADPQWQQAFSNELGSDVSQYKDIGALKAAYVAEVAPGLAKSEGVPLKQAKVDAGTGFERFDIVKAWRKEDDRADLEFWQAHPDLLKQSVDAGMLALNQDTRPIYQSAANP